MNGKLSTHVLDTRSGKPAANLKIELLFQGKLLTTYTTNPDGRTDSPLVAPGSLQRGEYEIRFHVGTYFQEKTFLDVVPVRFTVTDPSQNFHVPLLCSPYTYTTYRGS
jgi:5-hydroxyisourate hydrolase